MKDITWATSNRQEFNSPHKAFNRQVQAISTGNVIANTQYSNYIRPYNEVECNGHINEPGHLQTYDLTKMCTRLSGHILEQVRRLTHDNGGIIYDFHHWYGERQVKDGYVLTTRDHQLVKTWYVNPNWKAREAVNEAIKYITRS